MKFALLAVYCGMTLAFCSYPGEWPQWDGQESVSSYASRAGLPEKRSVNLGGDTSLELTLIPAGQFWMGKFEPARPSITEDSARQLMLIGGVAVFVALFVFIFSKRKGRRFSFSLGWLMLLTAATGVLAGGVVQLYQAPRESARYESERALYKKMLPDEKNVHLVTISRPFYLGVFTTTQSQYKALMGAKPSFNCGDEMPVENVSWHDARAFCALLAPKLQDPNMIVRLPTEAEWEFACRGGAATLCSAGHRDADLDSVAWYEDNSGGTTHPVGKKRPNRFGLYDMHGNVWQWCEDVFIENLGNQPATDPLNHEGTQRALRGGTYCSPARACWTGSRIFFDPENRYGLVGFRVAIEMRR